MMCVCVNLTSNVFNLNSKGYDPSTKDVETTKDAFIEDLMREGKAQLGNVYLHPFLSIVSSHTCTSSERYLDIGTLWGECICSFASMHQPMCNSHM